MNSDITWKRLDSRAIEPRNAYNESAGWDLFCVQGAIIGPGTGRDLRTGIAIALQPGFFARIVGRSSALRKRGILIVEGIIDEGFRGELFSYAFNPGSESVEVVEGDSLAQLIVCPVVGVQWHEQLHLPESVRGERGFGSSDEWPLRPEYERNR